MPLTAQEVIKKYKKYNDYKETEVTQQDIDKFFRLKDFELTVHFTAEALLWDQNAMRSSKVTDIIVDAQDLEKARKTIRKKTDRVFDYRLYFKKFIPGPVTVFWNDDLYMSTFKVLVKNFTEYVKFMSALDFFLNGLRDGACDSYMCGDVTVFETNNAMYELVFGKLSVIFEYNKEEVKDFRLPSYWR
jgi:hypothetical protein